VRCGIGVLNDSEWCAHFAVEKGDEELVKLLLECGANVDAQDKGHKNALHFAAESSKV